MGLKIRNLNKMSSDDDEKIKDYFKRTMPCDISAIINVTKMFVTDSASNAIIVMGNLTVSSLPPKKVVIKMTFAKDIQDMDNSATVEREVYSTIINRLIIDNNTPCVAKYISHYKCASFDIKFQHPHYKKIYDEYVEQNTSPGISKDLDILVTEYLGRVPFKDFNFRLMTEDQIFYLIFMLLQTLYCFSKLMLSHNDIHYGNVMIMEERTPTTYRYDYGGKVIEFQTRFLPKIFDFDRAAIYYPGVQRNMALDDRYCKNIGQCNMFTEFSDLFTVLFIIQKKLDSYPMISQLLSDSNFDKVHKNNNYPVMDKKGAVISMKPADYVQILLDSNKEYAIANMTPLKSLISKFLSDNRSRFIVSTETKDVYKSPMRRVPPIINPVYSSTTEPLDIDDLKDGSRNIPENEYKKIIEMFYDMIKPSSNALQIFTLWKTEADLLNKSPDVLTNNIETILVETMKAKRKTSMPGKTLITYVIVCFYLSLPFSNSIPKDYFFYYMEERLQKSQYILEKIISDIWNANNNVLPIKVPALC